MSDDKDGGDLSVAEKMAEFLAHGTAVLVSHGVNGDRIGYAAVPHDPAVKYVTVDDVPVFRAIAVPDEVDGRPAVAFYGSWLAASDKHTGGRAGDAWDADEGEPTDSPVVRRPVVN